MSYSQLPVNNSPNQEFDITLPVDNANLKLHFTLRYNTVAEYWVMDITNKETGVMLLTAIPLLTGSNLLEQYTYLGIGSAYVLKAGDSSLENPDDKSLGTDFLLVWGDTVV
jgi:hypothetical protein